MPTGKGFAYSCASAVIAAAAWIVLIELTGWGLWVLAPIVGGAAGYGMMRATKMRGGTAAGVGAAAVTVLAIFGARAFVVSSHVERELAITEEDAIHTLAADVAEEWDGDESEVVTEEGEYTAPVMTKARERWNTMSAGERQSMTASMSEGSAQAGAVLTPLVLIFDFGIFGTICTALAAGGAYKAASTTLERAIVDKGYTGAQEEAAQMAADLRAGKRVDPAGPSGGVVVEDSTPIDGGFFAAMRAPDESSAPSRGFGPAPEGAEEARRAAA